MTQVGDCMWIAGDDSPCAHIQIWNMKTFSLKKKIISWHGTPHRSTSISTLLVVTDLDETRGGGRYRTLYPVGGSCGATREMDAGHILCSSNPHVCGDGGNTSTLWRYVYDDIL
eukprot:TRINITY_DN9894_c0_g1_i1.p1 TRINITY_DN9894_c0_g1~~TRINITY_DN9894_c0_g1_i1.p1  ORF type:complete len:114 (-),score=11.29 TRINITY_DN9894_c0_g1_i1:72-413(-)